MQSKEGGFDARNGDAYSHSAQLSRVSFEQILLTNEKFQDRGHQSMAWFSTMILKRNARMSRIILARSCEMSHHTPCFPCNWFARCSRCISSQRSVTISYTFAIFVSYSWYFARTPGIFWIVTVLQVWCEHIGSSFWNRENIGSRDDKNTSQTTHSSHFPPFCVSFQ